jgi:hypothetical protein
VKPALVDLCTYSTVLGACIVQNMSSIFEFAIERRRKAEASRKAAEAARKADEAEVAKLRERRKALKAEVESLNMARDRKRRAAEYDRLVEVLTPKPPKPPTPADRAATILAAGRKARSPAPAPELPPEGSLAAQIIAAAIKSRTPRE